jgi:hypothetical protein
LGKVFPESVYWLNGKLMGIWVSLQKWAQQAHEGIKSGIMAHPRRLAAVVLIPLALAIVFACVQPALAAVQLNFFNVIAFPTSVTLEWSTSSEVNLAGFDIQCKQTNEPDTAFHEIGFQRAQGGPNVGALYNFPVTSGMVPGVSYCFRLKEITTDGSAGEVIDRCGYGPMVTPTPGLGAIPVFTPVPVQTDAFGNPIVPTPTPPPVPPAVVTDPSGNPIQPIPGAVPTDAFGNPIPPTPFNQVSPLATPFPGPVATDAFGNPLPTPIPQAAATDQFGNPLPPTQTPQAAATDQFGNPLPTPMPQAVATDQFGNPLPTPIPQPVATDQFGNPLPPTQTPQAAATDQFGNPLPTPSVPAAAAAAFDAYGNPLPAPMADLAQGGAPMAGDTQAPQSAGPEYAQPATPTVAYIVVTATPTEAPVALAPVFTPLPTATPLPAGVQLANSLQPSGQNLAQNLMIMLLCLTFTGATGIGIIGLITSVMFMRARSSQRDFYERTSVRRRF